MKTAMVFVSGFFSMVDGTIAKNSATYGGGASRTSGVGSALNF
jgi:hypothetical protein